MTRSEFWVYTIGRALTVACRPLILFLTVNFLSPNASNGLAAVFLANTLGLSTVAADPHWRFYPRYFGVQGRVNGIPFYLYFISLLITTVPGGLLVMGISAWLSRSLLLTLTACLYFLSEKIVDEALRLKLFEERLDLWGRNTLYRTCLQFLGLGVLYLIFRNHVTAWMEILAFTAGNLAIFMPTIPKNTLGALQPKRIPAMSWLVRRSCRWLYSNWGLWVLALVSSANGYLDRCIGVFVDRWMFPLFMLVAMCLSNVQLIVNFYYLSPNRRAFLDGNVTARDVLLNASLWASVAFGLLLGGATAGAALYFSKDGARFPIRYLVLIAAFQVLLSIISVIREIPYWKGFINLMVWIEVGSTVLLALIVGTGWSMSLRLPSLFLLIIGAVLGRLMLFSIFSSPPSPSDSRWLAAVRATKEW